MESLILVLVIAAIAFGLGRQYEANKQVPWENRATEFGIALKLLIEVIEMRVLGQYEREEIPSVEEALKFARSVFPPRV